MLSDSNALPRVSTILKILDSDSYLGVPQAALEKAAERGTQLHQVCLTYLASLDGVHEAPAVDIQYQRPYQAFVKWCHDAAVLVVAIEERSTSKKYGFTGTPDALVIVRGEELLIDLKFTATVLRINRVQIQAYLRLDEYKTAKGAALLHINPVTGDMKVFNVKKNPSDWAAFLNGLSIWRWRQGS